VRERSLVLKKTKEVTGRWCQKGKKTCGGFLKRKKNKKKRKKENLGLGLLLKAPLITSTFFGENKWDWGWQKTNKDGLKGPNRWGTHF